MARWPARYGVLLTATVLVACQPQGLGGSAVQPLPSTGASTAPPASGPSTSPASEQPAPSGAPGQAGVAETGTIRGKVYDIEGALVSDGARITVVSLDKTVPFEASGVVAGGQYVVNGIPLNTQVSVAVSRPGWTTRTRVAVVRRVSERQVSRNMFNFGGPDDAADPDGPGYFIADYPEIERVEPVDLDSSLSNAKLNFKLVVSEPLDVSNQRRLAAAFLIIPNNAEALAANDALPAETEELPGLRIGALAVDAALKNTAYRYRQNSGFLNGYAVSEFKWASDNRTATFALDAPIKTGRDREAAYAFLLVAQDDEVIKDQQGVPLGQDLVVTLDPIEKDKFGNPLKRLSYNFGQYSKGEVIASAVREAAISFERRADDDGPKRWAQTHQSFTTFKVAQDEVAPKLERVLARRQYVEDGAASVDRIELTFSEPMVAYPRITSPGLLSLNNYVIATGTRRDELEKQDLGGALTPGDIAVGSSIESIRKTMAGRQGMLVASNKASDGDFKVNLSPKNPRVVILSLPGGAFPLDAEYVKVWAGSDSRYVAGGTEELGDPALNPLDDASDSALGAIE